MRRQQMEAYLAEQAKQAQAQAPLLIPVDFSDKKSDLFGQSALEQVKGVVGNA